jgi:HAD superfamily hydrolase (TIGR01509 family)
MLKSRPITPCLIIFPDGGVVLQKRKIEAVIFDLDGVLVQTERVSWKTWLDFIRGFGKEMGEDDFRRLIGTHNSSEDIRASLDLPMTAEEITRDHQRRLMAEIERGVPVTDGIVDLLTDLSTRSIPMAVASNSARRYVLRILELTELEDYFQTVVTRDDVPNPKPAPDVYLEAASRLGIPSSACMAIEDSPIGLEASLAADMLSIVVPNPDLIHKNFDRAHQRYETVFSLHKALKTLF